MCLYEFDEKAYLQNEREYWYEEGVEDGIAQGEVRLSRVNQLYSILIDLGKLDDLKRATQDKAYQEQLMNELLSEETPK